MYYYSNRCTMSGGAAWPGAEGQQSCCGGGGGGRGEPVNGNGGGEITEARALRDWESATCDSANATRSARRRDREDGAVRGLSRCCRGGGDGGADGEEGGADGGERRACSYSGAWKRVCFSGRSAALHCGASDSDSGTGSSDEAATRNRQSRRGVCSGGAAAAGDMDGTCRVINGKRRGGGPDKGYVRLCRVRSFLASAEGVSANGVTPLSHHNPPTRFSATGSPLVNGSGSWLKQVHLGERTDMLWRRLHAVQVKQVERHLTQQLGDVRRASMTPNFAELRRLARSCSEALRMAGGALDSDYTASSSGGGSDSEEEEEGGRRGRHASPSRICVRREWQWMEERAWLGSRWVWLQAQVSELEYRIRVLTELYTHLRQGKVLQCRAPDSTPEKPLGAPRPCPGPRDHRNKLAEDSVPLPHPAHTSSAARVRPRLRQCRPRLIRLNACPALGSKVVTLPRCSEPPAVCVLCGPPHPPAHERSTWACQKALEQRIHPVLSMPSDFPSAAYGMAPPLAVLQSPNSANWMERQGPRKAGRVRKRILCPRPPGTLPPLSNTSGGSTCRSLRGVASPGLLPQHATDMPTQPIRRRKGETSFDIDNLVMPLGLTGLQARVQRLQYKEIVTPSWRELDSLEASQKQVVSEGAHASQQLNGGGVEHTIEVDDLSDAVFLKRHAVWESRERSRWGSRTRRRHRGRSSSFSGTGDSCKGSEQTPSCPEPKQERNSPRDPFYTADKSFDWMQDEQSVLAWERRSFPLLEEELRCLQDDEEDTCAVSGRSQSTDSGISVGSLELSPRTPHHISYTQEATNHSPQLRIQTPPYLL